MAARPISSATISFGLVSIPIQLYSSSETSQKVRFNFLAPDGARVKQQYVHSRTSEPVPRDQLMKGYQFAKDQYVTFTSDELKALEAEATQSIDIVEFVPIEQVERAFIGKTYYLGSDKRAAKHYKLLGAAMEKTGRAALAKYSARGKQYLVLVRPVGDHLVMEQLHYAHEVRDMSEVPAGDGDLLDAELEMAMVLIDQIASDTFDPSQYQDEVGQRMLGAIEKKIADGAEITAPSDEAPVTQVIDLMEALKASVRVDDDAGKSTKTSRKKKSA